MTSRVSRFVVGGCTVPNNGTNVLRRGFLTSTYYGSSPGSRYLITSQNYVGRPTGPRTLHGRFRSMHTVCYSEYQGYSVRFDDNKAQLNTNGLNEVIDSFVSGNGHPVELAQELVDSGANCAMSHTLLGLSYLFGEGGYPGLRERLKPIVEKVAHELKTYHLTDSEAAFSNIYHMNALCALYNGNVANAIKHWESSLLANPLDIVAIRCAQETYLSVGDSANALGVVERVMEYWTPEQAGFSRVLGLHSVGLFENGFIVEGQEAAGKSLVVSTDNVIAILATISCFIQVSYFREGLRLMREMNDSYEGEAHTFLFNELYQLKAGFQIEQARLSPATHSLDICLDDGKRSFVNASNCLLRLIVGGATDQYYVEKKEQYDNDTSITAMLQGRQPTELKTLTTRYEALCVHVDMKVEDVNELDFHKVIVLIGAGRSKEALEYISMLEEHFQEKRNEPLVSSGGDDGKSLLCPILHYELEYSNILVLGTVVIPLCKAFHALLLGDDAKLALNYLVKSRPKWHLLFGKKAYREILEQFLVFTALRSVGVTTDEPRGAINSSYDDDITDYHRFAKAIVSQRASRQHHSALSWEWHSRICLALGDEEAGAKSHLRARDAGHNQGPGQA